MPDELDDELSVAELMAAVEHCAQVRGAADYRMLRAVSLIHEQREDEYISEVAARCQDGIDVEARNVGTVRSPRDQFGLTGLERAVAEVGAVLYLTPQRAKKLIAAASAARYRLPETARTMATGIIDLERLRMAIARTDLVGFEQIRQLDIDLATELGERGPMSTQRFQALVDTLICRWDPDALRRRASRADQDRNITIGPDRFNAGQARISGTLPAHKAAIIDARLTAMATEVHAGDDRTRAQLRADAYLALAQGHQHLTCRCADCIPAHPAAPAESTDSISSVEPAGPDRTGAVDPACPIDSVDSTDPSAELVDNAGVAPQRCSHPTRPTMHVVVNLSTLLGLDDDPAYLDGHGVIAPDIARSLLLEARRAYITPPREDPEVAAERYRPSRRLRALIHAGELCCQAPGCNNSVSQSDLDHYEAFAKGGKTIRANIGPLCRFHHRAKTFGGWQQYQNLWGTAVFTAPTGHSFIGNAYTGTDIFAALAPGRPEPPPQHLSRTRFDQPRHATRTHQKHARQRWEQENPPPY